MLRKWEICGYISDGKLFFGKSTNGHVLIIAEIDRRQLPGKGNIIWYPSAIESVGIREFGM